MIKRGRNDLRQTISMFWGAALLALFLLPPTTGGAVLPDNLAVDAGDLTGDGQTEQLILTKRSVRSATYRCFTWTESGGYTQIDPAPFLVNRKLLLGKAWVVYFPAPRAVSQNGKPFIPDFGRLRFIR